MDEMVQKSEEGQLVNIGVYSRARQQDTNRGILGKHDVDVE